VQDLGMMRGDESHAAHVRCERIHVVDAACRFETCLVPAQIEKEELVCCCRRKFRLLQVDAAYPRTFPLELLDEMMADESTRTSNKDSLLLRGC
jgi:hypothetical protein